MRRMRGLCYSLTVQRAVSSGVPISVRVCVGWSLTVLRAASSGVPISVRVCVGWSYWLLRSALPGLLWLIFLSCSFKRLPRAFFFFFGLS